MDIVVVGGAGFVGSHLVDRLLAEEHAVDVIDDLSVGSLANLADARASGGTLKIHHLDASSPEADSLIGMRQPDVVYQLALLPRHDRSARAQGRVFSSALATLEAARKFGIGKVVVALPASALYGQPAVQSLPVKEGELTPRGVRGVVARSVVDLLTTYREQYSVEFTALAMSTVYGPRQRPGSGVVASFLEAARTSTAPAFDGDGRQTRDLLYIDDAVDALVRASDRGSGLVVNIGTGEQTSIRDLWDRLGPGADVGPTHRPERADELARFAVSPVRARIHLAWSPWTDLDTGLSRLRNTP
jgi:UDP-glucose 4-epimerase